MYRRAVRDRCELPRDGVAGVRPLHVRRRVRAIRLQGVHHARLQQQLEGHDFVVRRAAGCEALVVLDAELHRRAVLVRGPAGGVHAHACVAKGARVPARRRRQRRRAAAHHVRLVERDRGGDRRAAHDRCARLGLAGDRAGRA
eukprot:126248-Chlamydomonas_euryale.AAC.1